MLRASQSISRDLAQTRAVQDWFTADVRASRQEQTGGAGASEIAAKFQRLNWGVAHNTPHDLGTDLWLMVRDERRFDLGLLVGAQAKAGPTWFSRPHHDESGAVDGWWFYENDRHHFDAWIAHSVPHLIVLHDLDESVSYWAHVTAAAVVSTGAGARILVPRGNRVDQDNLAALVEVATSRRAPAAWEGSAWRGATMLAPKDRLRYALIAPRLVAPHRNAGFDTQPRPDQVLALLAQARMHDVEALARRHPGVPNLDEALTSPDWAWRFVGALGRRLVHGDIDALELPVADAPGPPERAAATIVAAAAYLDQGEPDSAIRHLESSLAFDDTDPLDHAWLTAQLARANVEIGRLAEAREQALSIQQIRATHPDDVTAGAIAAATASLMFHTSDLLSAEVSGLIETSDTTTSWWRTQTVSWGLTASLDQSYRSWADDTSVFVGGPNTGHNDLLAAALTTSFACDHSGWRRTQAMLAKNILTGLTRKCQIDDAASAVTTLQQTGDTSALKLALDHLVDDGPAGGATQAAREVDLTNATHTTGQANLVLLERAGDVLDHDTAERTIDWILATLEAPDNFLERTWPRYLLNNQLTATLARVIPASSSASIARVLEAVLDLPPQTDQSAANSWGAVVRAIPSASWTTAAAARAASRAPADYSDLRYLLLGAAAPANDTAADLLLDEIRTGSLEALSHIDDVRELPDTVAAALIDTARDSLTETTALARRGGYSTGGVDPAHALTILNLWHPQHARWDELLDLLNEPMVRGDKKVGSIRALTRAEHLIPPDLKPSLADVAARITEHPDRPIYFGDHDADERGPAAALVATLRPADTAQSGRRLIKNLAGDDSQREAAAYLAGQLGRPEDLGVLSALTTDLSPRTRSAAAAALAAAVANNLGGQTAVDALHAALEDPGTRVAKAVVRALASSPLSAPDVATVLGKLTGHASAFVRRSAATVITALPLSPADG